MHAVRSARESRSVAFGLAARNFLVTGEWFCAHGKQYIASSRLQLLCMFFFGFLCLSCII